MRYLGIALAGCAVLILAACAGDGDGNAGGTTEALTADQFRRQADAICRKYEDRLEQLGAPTSIADLEEFAAKAVPLIEQGSGELHDLAPPVALRDDWDAAMELQDESVETMRDLAEAARRNDLSALQTITKSLDESQAESERLARKLGLHDCGEPRTATR